MENLNSQDFLNPQPVQVDMSKTEPLDSWGGAKVWNKSYILRLEPNSQRVIPIEVFIDPTNGRILTNTLPPEIRAYYEGNTLNPSPQPTPSPESPSFTWGEDNESGEDNKNDWGNWSSEGKESFDKTPNPSNLDQNNWGS